MAYSVRTLLLARVSVAIKMGSIRNPRAVQARAVEHTPFHQPETNLTSTLDHRDTSGFGLSELLGKLLGPQIRILKKAKTLCSSTFAGYCRIYWEGLFWVPLPIITTNC